MKFSSYFVLSLTAAVLNGLHAWHTHEQFYPIVIHLASDRVSLAVMYNFFFAAFLMLGWGILCFFLGRLRELEIEQLIDSGRGFLADTILFLVFYSPTIDQKEVSTIHLMQFIVAVIWLKMFHLICQIRVGHMFEIGNPKKSVKIKLAVLMFLLFALDFTVLFKFYKAAGSNSTFYTWILFEATSMAGLVFIAAVKYCLHLIDTSVDNGWPAKSAYLFYVDLIGDVMSMLIFLGYMSLFFIQNPSRLPIYMMADIISVARQLATRLRNFRKYRQIMNGFDKKFRDADVNDILRDDGEAETCIICRDDLHQGCVILPCNHIFHADCLKSWLIMQQCCPTCRADIPIEKSKLEAAYAESDKKAGRTPKKPGTQNPSNLVHGKNCPDCGEKKDEGGANSGAPGTSVSASSNAKPHAAGSAGTSAASSSSGATAPNAASSGTAGAASVNNKPGTTPVGVAGSYPHSKSLEADRAQRKKEKKERKERERQQVEDRLSHTSSSFPQTMSSLGVDIEDPEFKTLKQMMESRMQARKQEIIDEVRMMDEARKSDQSDSKSDSEGNMSYAERNISQTIARLLADQAKLSSLESANGRLSSAQSASSLLGSLGGLGRPSLGASLGSAVLGGSLGSVGPNGTPPFSGGIFNGYGNGLPGLTSQSYRTHINDISMMMTQAQQTILYLHSLQQFWGTQVASIQQQQAMTQQQMMQKSTNGNMKGAIPATTPGLNGTATTPGLNGLTQPVVSSTSNASAVDGGQPVVGGLPFAGMSPGIMMMPGMMGMPGMGMMAGSMPGMGLMGGSLPGMGVPSPVPGSSGANSNPLVLQQQAMMQQALAQQAAITQQIQQLQQQQAGLQAMAGQGVAQGLTPTTDLTPTTSTVNGLPDPGVTPGLVQPSAFTAAATASAAAASGAAASSATATAPTSFTTPLVAPTSSLVAASSSVATSSAAATAANSVPPTSPTKAAVIPTSPTKTTDCTTKPATDATSTPNLQADLAELRRAQEARWKESKQTTDSAEK